MDVSQDAVASLAPEAGAKKGRGRHFWTIGRKITVGFILAIVAGYAATVGLQATSQRHDELAIAEQEASVKTGMLANAMRVGVYGRDGQSTEEEYKPIAEAPGSTLAGVRVYAGDNTLIIGYDNPHLPKYDFTNIDTAIKQVLTSHKSIITSTSDHTLAVVPVRDLRGKKVTGALAVAWSLAQENQAVREQILSQIGAAAVVMLCLLGVLNLLIARVVTRPMKAMAAAMAALASGDTAVTVPGLGRGDEIGAMAGSVAVFRDNAVAIERMHGEREAEARKTEEEKRAALLKLAGDFEHQVSRVVAEITAASGRMADTADVMAATAAETSRQSSDATTNTRSALDDVQTVAASATQLAASISEITRQVDQSTAIAGSAVVDAERTNATVQSLAESASRIGEVVRLINDIASQTNLLALNATIEAARAGEAGKGFAVVASEVKNLAGQTAKATEEIASQIGAMQSVTLEAVSAIESIGRTIGSINETATAIAAAVEEQSAATQEIARAVDRAASGTRAASDTVARVTDAAGQTGRAAGEVQVAAKSLSGQAGALSQDVERFLAGLHGRA